MSEVLRNVLAPHMLLLDSPLEHDLQFEHFTQVNKKFYKQYKKTSIILLLTNLIKTTALFAGQKAPASMKHLSKAKVGGFSIF